MDKLDELGVKEEEVEILKEKLHELEHKIDNGASNSAKLNDAIEKLNEENQRLQTKLTEVEFEKSSFQNRFEFQSNNLLEKSSKTACSIIQ